MTALILGDLVVGLTLELLRFDRADRCLYRPGSGRGCRSPISADNPKSAKKIELGKKLFFAPWVLAHRNRLVQQLP